MPFTDENRDNLKGQEGMDAELYRFWKIPELLAALDEK